MWPTCGSSVTRRDISKHAPKHYQVLYTLIYVPNRSDNPNPDPAPTHMNFVQKKTDFLYAKKLVDHTKSQNIKYSPISIFYPRKYFSDAVKAIHIEPFNRLVLIQYER